MSKENNKLAAWKGGLTKSNSFNVFHDEFDNFIDRAFNSFWTSPLLVTQRNYRIYDVAENEKDYTITVEIPGYKKGEIKLEIVDNSIQLTAENSKGKYIKAWSLSGANLDKVTSKLEDGVLTITVEKIPEAQPKVVEIQEVK